MIQDYPTDLEGGVLAGRRIVLTRPREQAGDFDRIVRALGGEPVVAPAIAIAPPESWDPLDAALRELAQFNWMVFTSGNAVASVSRRLRALGLSSGAINGVKLAAVGTATADALARELRAPDYLAPNPSGKALGQSLPVNGRSRVLIPQGNLASPTLSAMLRDRGVNVTTVTAYRTIPGEGIPVITTMVRTGSAHALLFASGSALQFVVDALGDSAAVLRGTEPNRPAIFCIGPSTASVAEQLGIAPDAVAAESSLDALVDRMVLWFSASRLSSN
jgi:uroporphyrinogen III methyltransferase/synthase